MEESYLFQSLFPQLSKKKKKANAEGFSSELRRQHIDFFLDEVSETSFTAVVIMVEHGGQTVLPPQVSQQPSWKPLRDVNVCEY